MQPLRGVRDVYGVEAKAYRHVVEVAQHHARLNNYEELILPIFEDSRIYNKSLGETSDVVGKETYTFMDRDKTSITLRPEFTAGVVRSVISGGRQQSLPLKLFSYGPVFRHERPQKGRYRQFNQINFECIGLEAPYADVESIALAHNFLTDLGLMQDITLEISSIGSSECRAKFRAALVEYFGKYVADLSEDSKIRLEKNPLRILDSKDEGDKKLVANAPMIFDYLGSDQLRRFEKVEQGLIDLGITPVRNPKIVRGLDYYGDTVFEFVTNKLGSQGTVLAGGRWDGLFSLMGGANLPAIGWACGLERVYELAEMKFEYPSQKLAVLVPVGESALLHAPKFAAELRSKADITVDIVFHNNVSKQFQKANKLGADLCISFGDDELALGKVKVKNMTTGHEQLVDIGAIVEAAKSV